MIGSLARTCIGFILTSCLLSGCSSLPNYGDSLDISPFKSWKTLESKHFRIHFEEDHRDIAHTALQYVEEIHATLSPIFQWEPRHPVDITLLDNTDFANGLTIPVGRIGIMLYLTPPDNASVLYHWDDWFRLLILHEYVHYLNIDPTTGFMEAFRVVFGDIIRPNGLNPTWMLEGLAVYFETKYTRGGRGRSSYYEMLLRALVEANVLDRSKSVTLDRLNGNSPIFPLGSTPYFFGYALHQFIAKMEAETKLTYDESTELSSPDHAWGELSIRSSHRIPYFINDNLNNIYGKQWPHYWEEWVQYATDRAETQLTQIRSTPVTAHTLLTTGGFDTQGCAIHPDGSQIAYTRTTLDKWSSLYIRDLNTGKERNITPKVGGSKISYSPDGRYLIYSGANRYHQYNLYSDLFVYDLKKKRIRKISRGLRAKNPSFSSDGKWVTFTITRPGEIGLARAAFEISKNGNPRLGAVEALFWPGLGSAVYTPRYDPKKDRIVFSLHKKGSASEALYSYDLTTGKNTALVEDQYFNRFPEFDTIGNLYFVSNKTGVDNVYLLDPNQTAKAVTNVTTGIWLPCFSQTHMYGSLFSEKGFDLAQLPLQSESKTLAIDGPDAPVFTPTTTLSASEATPPSETRYHIGDTLVLPRYWSPQLGYTTGVDQLLVGVALGATDTLNTHRYDLALAGYFPMYLPVGYLSYLYRGLGLDIRPHLSFTANALLSDKRALIESEAGIELGYTFRWLFSQLRPSFRLYNRWYLLFESPSKYTTAAASLPVLEGSLRFQTSETSVLAITTEGGHAAGITSRFFPTASNPILESYLFYRAYLRIFQHAILSPYVSALISNDKSSFLAKPLQSVWTGADLGLGSSTPYSIFSYTMSGFNLPSFGFSQGFRLGLQFDFPIFRLFRGFGTRPIFFNQITGSIHPLLTYFPEKTPLGMHTFGAVKLRIALNFTLFYSAPLSLYGSLVHGFGPESQPDVEVGLSSNVLQF